MTTMTFSTSRPIHKRRWFKITSIILGIIVLLLIATLLFGYWFATKSLPDLSGEQVTEHVQHEVTVIRDERGVAQINAQSIEDLFFVQGYVTAQDRLFQMDMTRRLAGGKLAEVVGSAALESDIYYRTYGMHRTTDALVEKFNEETARIVEAYANGVNAYIEEAFVAGKQPLEFRILGYQPELWTSQDTALVVKYMGYTLSGNYRSELEHYQLVKALGEDAKHIIPEYHVDDSFPTIYKMEETTPFSAEALQQLTTFAPNEFNGSNNWVISGEYTESGFPMIGNDPHLGYAIPSVWYQTHLNLEGDFHSIGVTVPGVPGVVLGHNEHMAWGVTALSVDQQDLFLERVHPEKPNHYLYNGQWEAAQIVREEIKVKDWAVPHMVNVEITRNGPIINKVVNRQLAPYQAISLNWTGYQAGEELNGILRLNRATNVEEFNRGLDGFVTPALSWVFADRAGNIGFRGQSLMPIRQNSNGMLPVPGWDPDYQWLGFIPNQEVPQIINPARGYVMTANNKPVDDAYPYEIGRSFTPYRAERLTELIENKIAANELFTLQDMKDMQTDFLNTQARALLPPLLEAVKRSEEYAQMSALEQEALQILRAWDFIEDSDSAGAILWNHWYLVVSRALFADLVDFNYSHQLVVHKLILEANQHPSQIVFPYFNEEQQLSLDSVAMDTFSEAVQKVASLQGNNPNKWQWGKWHAMTIEHPLGAVKPLDKLFNRGTWELGGSGQTPGAMSFSMGTGNVTHGAGWRFAGDLSSIDNFYDIVMPGQSGQVFSPFYTDQVDQWAEGKLFPMIYHKGEQRKHKVYRFLPAS